MPRPYNPTNRPVLRTRDADRYADEAAAFLAALPPRPFPWTMVGVWGPLAALWALAAVLAFLPSLLGVR